MAGVTGYLLNTPNDRSGLIVVFTAVGVCWSLTVLVARLAGSLSRRRSLGWEDGGIIASTALGTAGSAAVFVAVRDGLGRRKNLQFESSVSEYEKALYIADILYILALALSKVAVLRLILGLRPIELHQRICQGLEVLTALWTVAAVLVVAIRCDTSRPWTSLTADQCPDLFTRWTALESVSLLIEVVIFGTATSMIWNLQMRLDRKLGAMVAFAIRLPVIIPTVLRLRHLRTAFYSSDYSLAVAGAIIAMQCNMHYSIMSASLSYLKPFLAAFDSNMGASNRLETVVATRSSERRKTNTAGSSGNWRNTVIIEADVKPEIGNQADNIEREGSEDSKAPIILKTTSYQVDVAR